MDLSSQDSVSSAWGNFKEENLTYNTVPDVEVGSLLLFSALNSCHFWVISIFIEKNDLADGRFIPSLITKLFRDSAVPLLSTMIWMGILIDYVQDIYSFLSFLVKDISSFWNSPLSWDENAILSLTLICKSKAKGKAASYTYKLNCTNERL